jgi:hypothetical protein
MTATRNNGPARPSRAERDPDRRPSEPPAPDGYWPGPLTVCRRCCCLVPGSTQAQRIHRQFHEQVEAGLPR